MRLHMESMLRNYLQLILEGGIFAERQERGVIESINKIASHRSPITVVTSGESISNVVHASKRTKLNDLGKEPYADIIFTLSDGIEVNVSAKGPTAPSLAGGGLVSLELLVPDIIERFLNKAQLAFKAAGYKHGQANAPDVFGKISYNDALLILKGNEAMGGPIHYIYQGPMDVSASYGKKSVLLNGKLMSVAAYAKSQELYLRARKRRIDQPLDLKNLCASGRPVLFGRSPSRGDYGRRIVISPKPSANALLIDI